MNTKRIKQLTEELSKVFTTDARVLDKNTVVTSAVIIAVMEDLTEQIEILSDRLSEIKKAVQETT